MNHAVLPFKQGACRPFSCYTEAWAVIKQHYWVYFGVSCVGLLIASAVPFGILMGPMFCGIYYCCLQGIEGKSVQFAQLFRGFDHTLQSIIATLLMMIPGFLLAIPLVFYIFVRMFFFARHLPPPGQAGGVAIFSVFAHLMVEELLIVLVLIFCMIPLSALFAFTLPLIVDKNLTGTDALLLSIRAGWKNFGGLIGLFLINFVLGMVGMLFCYIGAFFVLPLSMAATAVAYRQVFERDGA